MEIEKRTEKYDDGHYAEYYRKKGNRGFWHREDGPAWIVYNEDGSIRIEEYRINDKLHREDGPAYIRYNTDGSVYYELYWINNKMLSKEEWERDYGWKLQLKGTPMGEIFLTQN